MCVFLYCFGSGFYIRYACYTVYITFKYLYEASDPLEKNESPIKENDVQEPLTVNGAVGRLMTVIGAYTKKNPREIGDFSHAAPLSV